MLNDVVDSCLFLTIRGALIEVYCDFEVLVLQDVHVLNQGEVVLVSGVRYTKTGEVIFLIQGELY